MWLLQHHPCEQQFQIELIHEKQLVSTVTLVSYQSVIHIALSGSDNFLSHSFKLDAGVRGTVTAATMEKMGQSCWKRRLLMQQIYVVTSRRRLVQPPFRLSSVMIMPTPLPEAYPFSMLLPPTADTACHHRH